MPWKRPARRTCPWPSSARPRGRPRRPCPATSKREVGRRAEQLAEVGAARRRGRGVVWPSDVVSTPSGAHAAAIASRSCGRQRLEVGGHDGLRACSRPCRGQLPSRPMRKPTRPREVGRGERVLPGRLAAAAPAAVAGRPALQRVGDRGRRRDRARRHRHARARLARRTSSARSTRSAAARARPAARLHPRPRRPLRPGARRSPTAPAASCGRTPTTSTSPRCADDPEAALAAPRRDRAPERRARGDAAATRGAAPTRPPARSQPDRDLARPASRSRPTSAPGRCTRRRATRRRTSVLFQPERRLLISGDHLLGRVSLYFDYGCTPDPVGEFLGSLDTVEALGARLALSGHGRPFADVQEHIDANRAAGAQRLDAVLARARGRAVDRLRPAAARLRRGASTREMAGWLLTKMLCYLTHLEAPGAVERLGGRAGALGASALTLACGSTSGSPRARARPSPSSSSRPRPRRGRATSRRRWRRSRALEPDLRLGDLRRRRLAGREGQDGRHRLAHEARLRARGDGALHLRRRDRRGAARRRST